VEFVAENVPLILNGIDQTDSMVMVGIHGHEVFKGVCQLTNRQEPTAARPAIIALTGFRAFSSDLLSDPRRMSEASSAALGWHAQTTTNRKVGHSEKRSIAQILPLHSPVTVFLAD
jgi:hypothetical protein